MESNPTSGGTNINPVSPAEPVAPAPIQNQTQKLEGPISLMSESWELFKKNWKVIVPIVIVPTVIINVSQIFMITSQIWLIIVGLILLIPGIIMSIVSFAASTNTIHRLATEENPDIKFSSQYKYGLTFFGSTVLLVIMQVPILLGASVLFIIPGIIVSIYSGMYIYTLVLDGKKGFEAFTESYSLIKGRWLATFGRVLFPVIFWVIGIIILAGLNFILSSLLSIQPKSDGESVLSIILNLALVAALSPLVTVYSYKLYMALKSTRPVGVAKDVFKKWLVGFLVVGIISMIFIPIIAGVTLLAVVASKNERIPQINVELNDNASTTISATDNIDSSEGRIR